MVGVSEFKHPSALVPRFTAAQELKNPAKIRGDGQWNAEPLYKISGCEMMHGERNENKKKSHGWTVFQILHEVSGWPCWAERPALAKEA